jgi:short-subunit dehydrogenase
VVSPGFVATPIRSRAVGPDGQQIAQNRRDDSRDTMDVHTCVAQIVSAIDRRQRELVMTARGKVGMFLKLVAPGLVDRIALRAIRGRDS